MARGKTQGAHLLPLVAVSVPNAQVNHPCSGKRARFQEDSLSGHNSAQPLRTHELHGTALLVGGEGGGFEGNGRLRAHLSHFNLDLGMWASANPCYAAREISVPAALCTRQGASAVAHICSDGAGGGGNGCRRHWL